MYKLISHRGIHNKEIKENSYLAILNALKDEKYSGVEFDVRTTLDNEFILFHNSIYNNKLIKNTLYKELPKYVPKLEKILKINTNKIFLIEVKNINNEYNRLIDILNKYSNKNIYVMSFSNKVISKLNSNKRKYKIGILNYVLNTDELIKELDFVGILNSLLNNYVLKKLSSLEIFSYGILTKKEHENVFYIVDN